MVAALHISGCTPSNSIDNAENNTTPENDPYSVCTPFIDVIEDQNLFIAKVVAEARQELDKLEQQLEKSKENNAELAAQYELALQKFYLILRDPDMLKELLRQVEAEQEQNNHSISFGAENDQGHLLQLVPNQEHAMPFNPSLRFEM